MKFAELPDLEHLFEVNLFVYSLEPTKPDGEEGEDDTPQEDEDSTPEIAAQLIHRSLCHYPSTLYLNLYQNHFSYIKDMKIQQIVLLLSMRNLLERWIKIKSSRANLWA